MIFYIDNKLFEANENLSLSMPEDECSYTEVSEKIHLDFKRNDKIESINGEAVEINSKAVEINIKAVVVEKSKKRIVIKDEHGNTITLKLIHENWFKRMLNKLKLNKDEE